MQNCSLLTGLPWEPAPKFLTHCLTHGFTTREDLLPAGVCTGSGARPTGSDLTAPSQMRGLCLHTWASPQGCNNTRLTADFSSPRIDIWNALVTNEHFVSYCL